MQNGNPSSGNNLVAYIRNPIGQVVQGKTQDVTYSYNYDNAHRVTSVTDSRGNKQLSYFYSNAGLLLTMQDSDGNSIFASLRISNHKFQMANYSLHNRLRQFGIWNSESVIARRTSADYAYDPLGNRSGKTARSSTLAYVHDAANQLTEIRQTSITGTLLGGLVYDNNGNLTKKCESGTVTVSSSNCSGSTVTDLTHDSFNRLVQATKGTSPTEIYKYDDQGNRIQKTVGSTITNFLYNGPDVIGQYTSSWGTASAILTHGPGMDDPIVRTAGTTTQYFHQDGLGSVVSVTNQSGTTDGTARYDAWGNKIASTGTIPQYGYTGREPDDTGLVYYRARFYDPSIGRFTQRDPIGFNGGMNLYAYVSNDPINLTDSTGLWFGIDDATFTLGGAVLGATGQFIADALQGKVSSRRDLVAAAVGGAVTAEAALYAVPTLGPGGLAIAGGAGGAAANITGYLWDRNHGNAQWDSTKLVYDIAIGAGTALIPAGKWVGLNSGNNSFNAVFNQMTTKAITGTASSVSIETAAKMFVGSAVDKAFLQGAVVSGYAGTVYEEDFKDSALRQRERVDSAATYISNANYLGQSQSSPNNQSMGSMSPVAR